MDLWTRVFQRKTLNHTLLYHSVSAGCDLAQAASDISPLVEFHPRLFNVSACEIMQKKKKNR